MDIAYVEAPHQLIEALDYARLNQETQTCYYIIRDNANSDQRKQFERLIQEESIELYKIIEIPNSNLAKKFVGAVSLTLTLFRVGGGGYYLIGDFRSFFSRLVVLLSGFFGKQVVLVDDGLYLLSFYKKIKTKDIIIYTSLPLDVSPNMGHEILHKQRSKIDVLPRKNPCVLFIGMKLVELGFISQDDYFDTLTLVKRRHADAVELYYYAHRQESADKLKIIGGLGYHVINPELPIEKHFEINGAPKGYYYSYYSTALYNLSCTVDDCEFFFINPNEDVWPLSYRSAIIECYKLLNSSNVTEICL